MIKYNEDSEIEYQKDEERKLMKRNSTVIKSKELKKEPIKNNIK
jgi:hypothetical protein